MRIAVCGVSVTETEQLCGWIRACCGRMSLEVEPVPIYPLEQLWEEHTPGAFPCVILGATDTAGFLATRRLRESDRTCRILLICDTDRYAVESIRLHVTDFILRPVSLSRLARGLELLFRRR